MAPPSPLLGALRPSEEARVLGQARDVLGPALDRLGGRWQPVHGDAHLGNALETAGGPVWCDFEDVIRAPVEWDLPCVMGGPLVPGKGVPEAPAVLSNCGGVSSF